MDSAVDHYEGTSGLEETCYFYDILLLKDSGRSPVQK
jgi:hypothetical protein